MKPRKKTTPKKTALKKTAGKAGATAAKVSRKTKEIARGAQKVGTAIGTIGDMVRKGGEAAEDLVDTAARKAKKRARSA
jgi:hypothetical protein